MTDDILCTIECLLRDLLGEAYGDPIDSTAGASIALGATFTPLLTTPRRSIVVLENIGAVSIEWSPTAGAAAGKTLDPGDTITLDRFHGSVYVRGAGGLVDYAMLTSYLGRTPP